MSSPPTEPADLLQTPSLQWQGSDFSISPSFLASDNGSLGLSSLHGTDLSPSSSVSDNGSLGPSAPHGTDYFLTKGLENVERKQYRDPEAFFRALRSQASKLYSGKAGQYAVFSPVTQDQLTAIERIRRDRYKGLRFHYFSSEETLIVKIIAGVVHEIASNEFANMLDGEIRDMGLRYHIAKMGATTYQGNGSTKEADCSWKPAVFRPFLTDWPTMVLECGVEKSLERLEADAHWWFEHSGGEVKIVLGISFSKTKKEIHFQQWEMRTLPGVYLSQGGRGPTRRVPLIVREFDIADGVDHQGSVMIKFERIFLRPPLQPPPAQSPPARCEPVQGAPVQDVSIKDVSVEVWNLQGPPIIDQVIPEGDFTLSPLLLSYYVTHVWFGAQ